MNRPRVEWLRYELKVGQGFEFTDPPAVQFSPPGFTGELKDGVLTVRPVEEYSSEEEARVALEPHLEAWSMHALLGDGVRLSFQFRHAEVVDQEPKEGVHHVVVKMRSATSARATVTVVRRRYPQPADGLAVSPDVRTRGRGISPTERDGSSFYRWRSSSGRALVGCSGRGNKRPSHG